VAKEEKLPGYQIGKRSIISAYAAEKTTNGKREGKAKSATRQVASLGEGLHSPKDKKGRKKA